eukprot:8558214-Ditylum_brightwellii.AAC.1
MAESKMVSLQPELKEIELDFLNKHEEVIKDHDGSSNGDSSIISGEDATTQESGENDDETLPNLTIHQKYDNVIMCHDDESAEEMNIPALKDSAIKIRVNQILRTNLMMRMRMH